MADADDITHCSVCFEAYTESGGHVPRLLPCTHTLCEKCIVKLLWSKSLTCPECRVKHPAQKGVKTFSQNKYIITYIKRKPEQAGTKDEVDKPGEKEATMETEETKKRPEPTAPSPEDAVVEETSSNTEETKDSPFNVKVTQTISTDYSAILCISLSTGNRVVVCGVERDEWRLTEYSLQYGGEFEGAVLDEKPEGMTEVHLADKPCVAISYGMGKRIEFRDASNLSKVLESYSVHHLPSRLCTSAATTLLYVDYLKTPRKVRWLDCGASPPKPAESNKVTETMHALTNDMCYCCIDDSDKRLLIITDIDHGICAYDAKSNELLWNVKGKLDGMEKAMNPWGVTTDGRGRLYVCDMQNECVQMFSAVDGAYVGCVLKKGEQGFGVPRCVRWYNENSSLIVAHKENNKRSLSVINVQENPATQETSL